MVVGGGRVMRWWTLIFGSDLFQSPWRSSIRFVVGCEVCSVGQVELDGLQWIPLIFTWVCMTVRRWEFAIPDNGGAE